MNEVLILIKRTTEIDENAESITKETRREVFARRDNIGMREFYAANAADIHPEAKFTLADYLDYNNETLVEYGGELFRVLRTYRTGQELELTVERAPADDYEEDEVDG